MELTEIEEILEEISESKFNHQTLSEFSGEGVLEDFIPNERMRQPTRFRRPFRPNLDRRVFIVPPKDGTASPGERLCRQTLERLFPGYLFPSDTPLWLISRESGNLMELDCYNKELNIAVEYQGTQHYQYPNILHRSRRQFLDLTRRDEIKRKLCKDRGVYLIEVPYCISNKEAFITYHMTILYQRRKIRVKPTKLLTECNITDLTARNRLLNELYRATH